jgi:1,4-dihydroxy-2-naphthoate octaprenyltransferase
MQGVELVLKSGSSSSAWLMAARPRTLSLSVTPVVVGAALAWAAEGKVHWLATAAAFIASGFIQVGTNLHNDAADYKRGGDGPDRIGPPRATASGLLSVIAVNRGALASLALAAVMGLYLVYIGGWPILILGLLSIASGWGYTGGPCPIAYTPLGEAFVVGFFGIGAVAGTYFLSAGYISWAAVTAGLALGSLTGAVLLVNNYRDAEADARVGRRTLPIVVGRRVTIGIYAGLILLPFALLPVIARELPRGHVWLAATALPLAAMLIYRFAREWRGPIFNRILVQTVQLQLLFSAVLSVGLLV